MFYHLSSSTKSMQMIININMFIRPHKFTQITVFPPLLPWYTPEDGYAIRISQTHCFPPLCFRWFFPHLSDSSLIKNVPGICKGGKDLGTQFDPISEPTFYFRVQRDMWQCCSKVAGHVTSLASLAEISCTNKVPTNQKIKTTTQSWH